MSNVKKKNIMIFIFLLCVLSVTGCKPVFQKKVDKFIQVELSKDELSMDTYYVKDGTKFIAVYPANVSSAKDYQNGQSKSICFLSGDYKTVPTLYKNEILAIASQNVSVEDINLVRYKEIGYSIGAYGLSFDEDGYLYGNVSENVYPSSNLYTFFSNNAKSKEIRFVNINGEAVSKDMISTSGIFDCMEMGKEYNFEYFAGTYYSSGKAIANTFMMEEFEYYHLNNPENTKNGYISFSMPSDAKSGWYYINSANNHGGLFRYIAHDKGIDISSVNMNEPYYTSAEEQELVYSQKFSTSFDMRVENVSLLLLYDASTVTDEIVGTAFSPDGTEYSMTVDKENHLIRCDLEEAMAGKWTVYIRPKTLNIINMNVQSNQSKQEITEEEFSIIIDQKQANYRFCVSYEGEGTIYAILVYPNGEMKDFSLYHKDKQLIYDAPFIDSGNYRVKVYHYTDTNVLDVSTQENTKTDSDIITITE